MDKSPPQDESPASPDADIVDTSSNPIVDDPDAGLIEPIETPIPEVSKVISDTKEETHKEEKPNNEHGNKPNGHGNGNIIIIKRIKKVVHGHHGGAWKIAYADFVTAMMTFFLLMWLLSMLNKYQLQGMSEYFQRPLKEMVAQKTDPKKDMIKLQDSSTTSKDPKMNKVGEAANIKDVPKAEQNKLASEQIKSELEKKLQSNPKISQYKNVLNFKVTSQGLKIELKDLKDKSMFSSGKTDFADYASAIIEWLATEMNKYPNRVMIVGHTDSKPIQGTDQYTNWELSADRSNATRRELVQFGMAPEKVVRIVGVADVDKLDSARTSEDAANRRIEIVILNDDTYNKMQNE